MVVSGVCERCACMAGPKCVNKITVVFCLGGEKVSGVFFWFPLFFTRFYSLSLSRVVPSPFPFSPSSFFSALLIFLYSTTYRALLVIVLETGSTK
ncbi:hypothetical protein VNO78_28713 [Psophocarpus tetragonolobus]|uniref:Uncharacterized protein n=1 Tax=Psophocarpus tetragonolobus TaxID=3891 RepID=A0AAN9RTN8_PSOTE